MLLYCVLCTEQTWCSLCSQPPQCRGYCVLRTPGCTTSINVPRHEYLQTSRRAAYNRGRCEQAWHMRQRHLHPTADARHTAARRAQLLSSSHSAGRALRQSRNSAEAKKSRPNPVSSPAHSAPCLAPWCPGRGGPPHITKDSSTHASGEPACPGGLDRRRNGDRQKGYIHIRRASLGLPCRRSMYCSTGLLRSVYGVLCAQPGPAVPGSGPRPL